MPGPTFAALRMLAGGCLAAVLAVGVPGVMAPARVPPTREEGERLAQAIGCAACHTITGVAQLGPSWLGLFGTRRTLANGTTVVADEAYLRKSIMEPAAKVVPGFEAPMPSYGGILDESQVESLVLYIKGLP